MATPSLCIASLIHELIFCRYNLWQGCHWSKNIKKKNYDHLKLDNNNPHFTFVAHTYRYKIKFLTYNLCTIDLCSVTYIKIKLYLGKNLQQTCIQLIF